MSKALIVTAHINTAEQVNLDFSSYNCVICADGGVYTAKDLGLTADWFIGDFDSGCQPDNGTVIKLPVEKNMTDSEAAIDLAVQKGFDDITVLGGLGGRFDHTMGNIGMLAKYCGEIKHLALADGQNYVFMTGPASFSVPKNTYKYLGVISYGGDAFDVTLRGVKYPLTNHLLTNATTLGVSNEITAENAEISFSAGKLLIILSKDIDK